MNTGLLDCGYNSLQTHAVYRYARTRAYTDACIRIRTRTCTHAHTHTATESRIWPPVGESQALWVWLCVIALETVNSGSKQTHQTSSEANQSGHVGHTHTHRHRHTHLCCAREQFLTSGSRIVASHLARPERAHRLHIKLLI